MEKAALLGQGSPKGRQAWDLWSRDKLSSGKCGYASSGGYCFVWAVQRLAKPPAV